MRLLILFLFITSSLLIKAQTTPTYPSIETITEQLLIHYNIKDLPWVEELTFEKRRSGWVISGNPDPSWNGTYWNAQTRQYQSLNIPGNPELMVDEQLRSALLDKFFIHGYNSCLYYGYTGWPIDVISDFPITENMSDSLLYGLARAYSALGSSYISKLFDGAMDSLYWNPPLGKNSLTEEQLETYLDARHTALDLMQRIIDHDPLFQTLVGDIRAKYAGETMSIYLDMLTFQNAEIARAQLKPNLFSQMILDFGRNLLKGAPQNAIIISQGDMVTFSTMYVQETESLRRDVTIIDLTQMSVPRYVEMLYSGRGISAPLPGENINTYLADYYPYQVYLSADSTIAIEHIYEALADTAQYKLYDTLRLKSIPGNVFEIRRGGEHLFVRVSKKGLMVNELHVINLCTVDLYTHPICIPITTSPKSLPSFGGGLEDQGYLHVVKPFDTSAIEPKEAVINIDAWFDNVMHKWDYTYDPDIPVGSAEKGIWSTYKYLIIMDLCDALVKEEKYDSLKLVLDRFNEYAQWEKSKSELNDANFVPMYCRIKDYKTAQIITENLLITMAADKGDMDQNRKVLVLNILRKASSTYPKANLEEIIDRYDK